MRFIYSPALLLLTLAACSSNTGDESDTTPDTAMKMKPSAPVEIEALDLSPSSTTLRMTFGRAADGVAVKVYGVDGLTVRDVPNLGTTFTAGEVATLPVTFVPGAGRSYLAVMVTGNFAGREDVKVVSFAIGEPTTAQRDAAEANVITDADGRRIRVQPADPVDKK